MKSRPFYWFPGQAKVPGQARDDGERVYLHRRRPEGAERLSPSVAPESAEHLFPSVVPESAGHLSPSVVPESAKHLSGILEQKEGCLDIAAFLVGL